jgi:predicted chitinase
MASYNTSGVTSYTDTSSIAGISAASGQNYGSSSSGLMSSSSSKGRNRDADMYAGSKYAPTSNAGTAKAKQSFAAIATASDDDNNYTPSALAPKFEAAGATLPTAKDPRDRFRNTVASSLYDSDIFKPYVPDPTEEIESYLANTAVEDALKEALGIDDTERQIYQGIPTQEEPEPNIDMSVLQGALQPEPITVEELPEPITVEELPDGRRGGLMGPPTLGSIAPGAGAMNFSDRSALTNMNNLQLVDIEDEQPEGLMSPRFDTKGGEVAGATTKAYNFLIKAGLNPPENQLLSEKLTVTGDQFTNREDALEFINDSLDFEPTRKAAFSATVDAESSSGLLEGTNYSKQGAIATLGGGDANRIARIEALYGRNNRLSPEDQETLFNIAYGGRMGNAPDEGHKYRGRGLIQITGKDNYRKYGEAIGIGDALVNNPDILLNNPSVMLAITEAYLQDRLPERADGLSANDLKDAIGHSGAVPRGVTWNGTGSAYKGNQRWMDVIARLEEAGKQEEADEARLNNEFTAQQRAGAFIDGDIGPGSIRSMREFLIANGVTIPEDASARELVRLVNGV